MKNQLIRTALALTATLAACGDNADGPADAGVTPDAPVAAFMPPTPFGVPLAAAGPDQLQSVTAAPGSKFYAAGYAATTLAGTRFVTVVKYSAMGPDTTFGTGGVVTTAVDFKGGNDEVDITTQPDGKILVSATVANATVPADRDVAVIRLLDTGALDTTFGTQGVATINLNDALGGMAPDAARSIAADATGIYILAASRGIGAARTDTDFTVAKLTSTGALDTTYGDQGSYRRDIDLSNATPRNLKILAGGKVLVGGYASSPGFGTPQPVLFKLTALGQADATFATGGMFHELVLALQTEIYNFAVHGNKIVTGGYGRAAGTMNEYISLRFDLETGVRDTTWGANNGAVVFDPSGSLLGSNCRNATGLPNGKTLMVGSIGPNGMQTQDAVFAVLAADGKLDTTYGTGIHKFTFAANGAEQFWGAAVSGDLVSVVGFKGAVGTATETNNDDSFGIVFTAR